MSTLSYWDENRDIYLPMMKDILAKNPLERESKLEEYETASGTTFKEIRKALAARRLANIPQLMWVYLGTKKPTTIDLLFQLDKRIGDTHAYFARIRLWSRFGDHSDVISANVRKYCQLTKCYIDDGDNNDHSLLYEWNPIGHPEITERDKHFINVFRDYKSFLSIIRAHPSGKFIRVDEFIQIVFNQYDNSTA